jgi:hypothetical protein
MEDINIVRFFDPGKNEPTREVITNINEVRLKIIRLFGETACEMYGLNVLKPAHPLRM